MRSAMRGVVRGAQALGVPGRGRRLEGGRAPPGDRRGAREARAQGGARERRREHGGARGQGGAKGRQAGDLLSLTDPRLSRSGKSMGVIIPPARQNYLTLRTRIQYGLARSRTSRRHCAEGPAVGGRAAGAGPAARAGGQRPGAAPGAGGEPPQRAGAGRGRRRDAPRRPHAGTRTGRPRGVVSST